MIVATGALDTLLTYGSSEPWVTPTGAAAKRSVSRLIGTGRKDAKRTTRARIREMIFPDVYSTIREALRVLSDSGDVREISCAHSISLSDAIPDQIGGKIRTIRGSESVPLRAIRRVDVRRGRIRHRVWVESLDRVQDRCIRQGEQGGKVGSKVGSRIVVSGNPDASLVCVKALIDRSLCQCCFLTE
jgi:hypothetical protein